MGVTNGGLQVTHAFQPGMPSERDTEEVLHRLERPYIPENKHIHQSIVILRPWKNRERPTVKPPITDQDPDALHRRKTGRPDLQHLRRTSDLLQRRPGISPGAEPPFRSAGHARHDVCVKPHARELCKGLTVCQPQIDLPPPPAKDRGPRVLPVERHPELPGKNVHRAKRQHAQTRGGPGQSSQDLIHRSITTGGDDRSKALCRSLPSKLFCLTRSGCYADFCIPSHICNRVDYLQLPSAAGLGIENNAVILHGRWLPAFHA